MLSDLLETAVIINILVATMRIATPLLIAACGELITERAGVMNLGLEGTMLTGAFFGFVIAHETGSLWLAGGGAMLAGAVIALTLAVMVISLKLDQTVSGLALNLLASGLTLFIYRSMFGSRDSSAPMIDTLPLIEIPLLSDIPYVGEIFFSQRFLTYFAFLIVPVVAFFLNRTRLGLRIRSVGENPRAVDKKGLSVARLRYFATILGGLLAGLGGAFLTIGLSNRFVPDITAGRGWLAIVIVIAGNWQPGRMLIAALVFAFLDALQLQITGIGVKIPFQIMLAVPYIFALLALMSSRVRSREPGALGAPYVKE